MRRFGVEVPGIPGTEASRLEALRALFHAAGLEQMETRTIDVCLAYADFEDFWQAQTPGLCTHHEGHRRDEATASARA